MKCIPDSTAKISLIRPGKPHLPLLHFVVWYEIPHLKIKHRFTPETGPCGKYLGQARSWQGLTGIFAELCADVLQLSVWLFANPFQIALAKPYFFWRYKRLPYSSVPESELLRSKVTEHGLRGHSRRRARHLQAPLALMLTISDFPFLGGQK